MSIVKVDYGTVGGGGISEMYIEQDYRANMTFTSPTALDEVYVAGNQGGVTLQQGSGVTSDNKVEKGESGKTFNYVGADYTYGFTVSLSADGLTITVARPGGNNQSYTVVVGVVK